MEADRSLPLSLHRYYINLCQQVYKGPLNCSDRASICKKTASGDVQVLGLVHTQKLDVIGKACVLSRGRAGCSRGAGRGQHRLGVKLPGTIPMSISQAF